MMLFNLGKISENELNSILNNESQQIDHRKPIYNLDEAKEFVRENFKNTKETLWISDELNDPVGMHMAIIGDGILKLGYMPDGFEQKDGYRIYAYIKE